MPINRRTDLVTLSGLLLSTLVGAASAANVSEAEILRYLAAEKIQIAQLREHGPKVMPVLAQLYESADEPLKAKIARAFYQLGWPSDEAYRALLSDARSTNPQLRLQVQWALRRVSADDQVVTTLLDIMQNDASPLFRDKAACALAYDQIHLDDHQRYALLQGLVAALSDPKPQVRKIAIQALKIHTGQTKGFKPMASQEARAHSIDQWTQWLADYRANL